MNQRLTLSLGMTLALSAACAKKSEEKPAAKAETQKVAVKTEKAAEKKPAAAAAAPSGAGEQVKVNRSALLDPSAANEKAPEKFAVKFITTKGDFIIDVNREKAPRGVDRFYNLVKNGYYNDVAFFRVISGFMAQVGISGDPEFNKVWRMAQIQDDPVKDSNTRGMVSYAMGGPNTRTTQFFINFGDNSRLDGMGFAPFGKVRDMAVVDKLHAGYGEGAPRGKGPSQGQIQAKGNSYLKASFPQLDYIKGAVIIK